METPRQKPAALNRGILIICSSRCLHVTDIHDRLPPSTDKKELRCLDADALQGTQAYWSTFTDKVRPSSSVPLNWSMAA